MKRVKKKINVRMNIEQTLNKMKSFCNVKDDKELAEILRISPQNFANKKKKGTLYVDIAQYAINSGMNFSKIFSEDSAARAEAADRDAVYNKDRKAETDVPPEITELLEGAKRVLMSGNKVAVEALQRNILYFSHAIEVEERESKADDRIKRLEEKCDELMEEIREVKKAAVGYPRSGGEEALDLPEQAIPSKKSAAM